MRQSLSTIASFAQLTAEAATAASNLDKEKAKVAQLQSRAQEAEKASASDVSRLNARVKQVRHRDCNHRLRLVCCRYQCRC